MAAERGPGALAGATEAGDRNDAGRREANIASARRGQIVTGGALDAALDYVRRGWRAVPIPAGRKNPAITGWPDFVAKPEDVPRLFGHGENVGVIFGPKSSYLVDVDLDFAEAVALADLYLPATGAVFGRPAKPRSHRLYVAPGAVYESFADPIDSKTILELRAAGRDGGAHLTLFPPSVADRERREWHGEIIAPAVIEATMLRRAIAWLAIGCLVMRYVSKTAARNPGPDLPGILWEVDSALGRRAFDWLGRPHPDAPRRYPRPRRELNRDDLDFAAMIAAIPNDFDWAGWNSMGMAIYAASGGSQDGFIAFDDLSARSPKYQPHAVAERWRNYRRSPPSRTGIGKLIALALAAGWRPSGRDSK